jgi:anti-sigma factor RsiW
MAECERVERVSAYHDGELDGPSRARLEAHLRACPACAAELARLRNLSQLIRAARRPRISAGAVGRLHRLADLQPKVALVRMAEVFMAAAALILVCSGVWLWRISSAGAASAQIPLWETAAVAPQDPSAVATQEQLAQWIVQDLSRKNGHD